MALSKKWTLLFSPKADREFKKLDKPIQKRILTFFDKLVLTPNPKDKGKQLSHNMSPFWCYRMGDYRVICRFEDNNFLIVAVKVGHRRDVYEFDI
jgi:mRNA interferase RelE/StbE